MTRLHNLSFYLFAIGIFFLIKFYFTGADVDTLSFLLKPAAAFTSVLTGSSFALINGQGYFLYKLNILIDASCSGINFWLLCYMMQAFQGIRFFQKPLYKLLALPCTLFIAYVATILGNTCRILASVLVQQIGNLFLPPRPHNLLHELTGLGVNMTFLIIIFVLAEKNLNRKADAKPATSPLDIPA